MLVDLTFDSVLGKDRNSDFNMQRVVFVVLEKCDDAVGGFVSSLTETLERLEKTEQLSNCLTVVASATRKQDLTADTLGNFDTLLVKLLEPDACETEPEPLGIDHHLGEFSRQITSVSGLLIPYSSLCTTHSSF